MPKKPKHTLVSHQEIGERVRLLRLDRGFTQVELGKLLDMNQSNLSAIERGIRGVTVNQVVRIATALGATTDEILVAKKAPDKGRRPKKKIMQRVRRIEELADGDQRILVQVLEGMLMRREERRQRRAEKRTASKRVAQAS